MYMCISILACFYCFIEQDILRPCNETMSLCEVTGSLSGSSCMLLGRLTSVPDCQGSPVVRAKVCQRLCFISRPISSYISYAPCQKELLIPFAIFLLVVAFQGFPSFFSHKQAMNFLT